MGRATGRCKKLRAEQHGRGGVLVEREWQKLLDPPLLALKGPLLRDKGSQRLG